MTINILEIVGYEPEHGCDHCGRNLLHGIALSDGRVVGATCFDKKLTKPRVDRFTGRKYRVGSEWIIKLAKAARYDDVTRNRMGYGSHVFRFEAI